MTPAGHCASALSLTAASQGSGGSFDVTTTTNASAALTTLDSAIDTINSARGSFGAIQNRLESSIRNIDMTAENLSAANSRIKDVDVAEESTQFARYNILVQAGTAMLAQANATPQSALRLLT